MTFVSNEAEVVLDTLYTAGDKVYQAWARFGLLASRSAGIRILGLVSFRYIYMHSDLLGYFRPSDVAPSKPNRPDPILPWREVPRTCIIGSNIATRKNRWGNK